MRLSKRRLRRLKELLNKLERGPHWPDASLDAVLTVEKANAFYHLWAKTWITSELKDLFPEIAPTEPKEATE